MRQTLIAVLLACRSPTCWRSSNHCLDVQNMTCALCSVTVKKALEKVPGVAEAKIDYDHKTATVKFDPEKASAAVLVKATTDAGFPATPHSSKP